MLAAHKRLELTEDRLLDPDPSLAERHICALSGELANSWCPVSRREWLPASSEVAPCSWHHLADEGPLVVWPAPFREWARRNNPSFGVMHASVRTPSAAVRRVQPTARCRRIAARQPAAGRNLLDRSDAPPGFSDAVPAGCRAGSYDCRMDRQRRARRGQQLRVGAGMAAASWTASHHRPGQRGTRGGVGYYGEVARLAVRGLAVRTESYRSSWVKVVPGGNPAPFRPVTSSLPREPRAPEPRPQDARGDEELRRRPDSDRLSAVFRLTVRQSPIGPLTLAARGDLLVMVRFGDEREHAERFLHRQEPSAAIVEHRDPAGASTALDHYFTGDWRRSTGCRSSSTAPIFNAGCGPPCGRSARGAPPRTWTLPAPSARPRPSARSARPTAPIRFPSWCPATGSSAPQERSLGMAAGSIANGGSSSTRGTPQDIDIP